MTYGNIGATTPGPAGMAFVGNNLYVSRFITVFDAGAANGNGAVDRYDISGGAPVFTATVVSGLTQPAGITVATDGSLLISSVGYTNPGVGEVTKYVPSTNTQTTFIKNSLAPGSTSNLVSASAAKFGPDGNLYVADVSASIIRKYNGTTGAYIGDFITTHLDSPSDLVFDNNGRVWVANLGNEFSAAFGGPFVPGSITRYDLNGTYIDTVANSDYYAQLVFQPIPEPSAVLGACSLVGAIFWRLKRRAIQK